MLSRSVAMVIALILLALSFSAQALDKRFTDEDGDLVADTPKDPKQWIDPPVLIFSYTPVEDPAVYAKVWDGFIRHMEKVTGKRVQFFPVQSNAAQLEAMRAGRLHVSGFNSGSNPLAVNCAGFVPFAMMTALNNDYGYEFEIITWPGSGVTKVEGLKGKKVAFSSQTSNSGFKAPAALLRQKFGFVAGTDYDLVFSGKHDNSIMGVINKDYPAAAVANSVIQRMTARNVIRKDQFVSLYKSQTFPTTGYGYVYNLKPELAAKVKEAFFTYPWEGSELLKEFGVAEPPQQKFMPITYKEHWQVVRDVDAAMGVSYDCKG
ncbi:MAG: phosphate/phosphite/phosphonate ABC transporter substrate-binding protein [Pseudorhodoplanes sp.]